MEMQDLISLVLKMEMASVAFWNVGEVRAWP